MLIRMKYSSCVHAHGDGVPPHENREQAALTVITVSEQDTAGGIAQKGCATNVGRRGMTPPILNVHYFIEEQGLQTDIQMHETYVGLTSPISRRESLRNSRDQENSVTLDVKIGGHRMVALLDTGARPSVINIGTLEQTGLVERLIRVPDQVYGLCKSPVAVRGYIDVEVQITNGTAVETRMKALESREPTVLLGREFLQEFGSVTFDFAQGCIRLGTLRIPIKNSMIGG